MQNMRAIARDLKMGRDIVARESRDQRNERGERGQRDKNWTETDEVVASDVE